MRAQPKNMIVSSLAVAAMVLAVGGCAVSRNSAAGPWRWSPPATLEMGHSGSSGAVIASPGALADAGLYAYGDPQYAPEYDRRDEKLGVGNADPTGGWYAWPSAPRPSLDHSRSFSGGRNADRYVYPTIDDDSHDYRYARPRSRRSGGYWRDR